MLFKVKNLSLFKWKKYELKNSKENQILKHQILEVVTVLNTDIRRNNHKYFQFINKSFVVS